MYLFTRSARLAPGNPETMMSWATQITEKVNQISELEVSLWTRVFSPGSGTLVWTATLEDLVVLENTEAKLIADSGYVSLVETGAKHSSGDALDDGLIRLVYPDPAAAEMQPQYATVFQTTLAPGSTAPGVELGVDIAQRAAKISGCPTSFGVATTGVYGGVEWISLSSSIEQLQKGQEAVAADAGFNEKIDQQASKLFMPNGMQTVYRRIC